MNKMPDEKVLNKCPLCPNAFLLKQRLSKHLRSDHGGVQVFDCEKCDYSSARSHELKRHYTAVHERATPIKSIKQQEIDNELHFQHEN